MRRIFILLSVVLIFSGCKEKNSFRVKGIVNVEKKSVIYIQRVDVDQAVPIDSAKISKGGNFSFKVKSTDPEFYQVGFTTDNFITILAKPGEKINLVFKGKYLFDNYSVTGSPESQKIKELDKTLSSTKRELDSLNSIYKKSSGEPGFEAKAPVLEAEYKRIVDNQRKYNIGFILKNISSLTSIKALYQRLNPDTYVLYDPRDLQYLKICTDSLTRRYPNSKHVQALARDFEKEMNQMALNRIESMSKDMPKTELNPILTDISGRRIALSSLKGKYVLLSFWTIKSNDCIEENLLLKELYKQYNKKGFEIYQIDVDENEADWKAAVKFDELPWISTREDNPADPKNAILFNVKSLPATYIFDREGTIVANNLHGRTLRIKLEQIFSK